MKKTLFKKYRPIFWNKHTKSYLYCEVGDGWFKLLDELCAELKVIMKITGIQITAVQVKEKFGVLRFYYGCKMSSKIRDTKAHLIWSNIIGAVVHNAEHNSKYTCEDCGAHGSMKSYNGWYHTACTPCMKKSYPGWKERVHNASSN